MAAASRKTRRVTKAQIIPNSFLLASTITKPQFNRAPLDVVEHLVKSVPRRTQELRGGSIWNEQGVPNEVGSECIEIHLKLE